MLLYLVYSLVAPSRECLQRGSTRRFCGFTAVCVRGKRPPMNYATNYSFDKFLCAVASFVDFAFFDIDSFHLTSDL